MASFRNVLFCVLLVFKFCLGISERKPVVIVASFDGYKHDYIKEVNVPKFNSLKADGAYSEYMINVFETKTYPNYQSIATGLYPESHGIISNSVFDPKYGRQIEYGAELYEYENVIPIWILNEVAGNGSHSGVMMWPGGEFPYGKTTDGDMLFKDQTFLPTFLEKWNMYVPWKIRVDTVMSWIKHPTTPTNLVMLYFEEPDAVAHAQGPESDNVKFKIQEIDETLSYLCDSIHANNLSDIVNVFLVSDHGMQTVTPSRVINLPNYINSSLYTTSTTSPVLHIYPVEGYEEEVYKQFTTAAAKESFQVYRKHEMPERWHIRNSRRTPPMIAVADDGYVFHDFYHNINHYRKDYNIIPYVNQTYGVHGYDNALNSMHPIFLAWGPLIKKGFTIEPFNSVDLFPLISKMLNLPKRPSNGTLQYSNRLLVSE